MLQPLDLESQDKNRHKFMVQSIFAPEGEYSFDVLVSMFPTHITNIFLLIIK